MGDDDAAHLPIADNVGNWAFLRPLASPAEWNVIHEARRKAMTSVEITVSALLREVMLVLQEAIGTAAEQVLHRLINRVRPRVCHVEVQSMTEPLRQAG